MDAVQDPVVSPGSAVTPIPATLERPSWLAREALILGLLMIALAAQIPLLDPDLPMHLALGEWIVQHGAVPFQEPFAWTRPGEPFYAYSWLPETAFYLVHAWLGPAGLRILQGILLVGAAGATIYLGATLRWRPGTTLVMAGMSIMVGGMVVPALRPQIILAIVLPIVWGLISRVVNGRATVRTYVGLTLWSALLANSHIFFVLTATPLILFWVQDRWNWRRILLSGLCIVAGWFMSPYALHWPAIFQANFGYNALLQWPSPISELRPGFSSPFDWISGRFIPMGALLLAPWLIRRERHTKRELLAAAVLWSIGLIGFGYAGRFLLLWWLLFLPFAGWVLEDTSPDEPDAPPRRPFRLAAYAAVASLTIWLSWSQRKEWQREGTTETRQLATGPARESEAVATWLDANIRPGVGGRAYTVFNFGSYLTWRLPSLSMSIDGRTIFPDSVASIEMFLRPTQLHAPLGPWRSSDLAIMETGRPVATVLDTASGWRRIAVSVPETEIGTPPPRDSVGLWVREEWWKKVGLRPLPMTPVILTDG